MALMDKSRLNRYKTESGSETTFIRIPFFKLGQGTTKVRILPGQEPGSIDKDFAILVYLHYKVSPSKPTVPVVCAKTKDPRNRCVICDFVRKLKESDDQGDQRQAEEMGQRMKYAMGLIPLEGEDRGKQMVFMAPKIIWSKIIALGGNSEYGDITNPHEGFDVTLEKKGSGKKGTSYDCMPVRMPSPIASDPAEVEEILAAQFDLWRFKVIPSAAEIEAFMNGEIDRLTTDGFSVKKEEVVAEPVEEAIEEEETEAVEEEAPAPKTFKKAAPVAAPVEEEEEEEEAPVRPPPPTSPVATKAKANLDSLRSKLSGKV